MWLSRDDVCSAHAEIKGSGGVLAQPGSGLLRARGDQRRKLKLYPSNWKSAPRTRRSKAQVAARLGGGESRLLRARGDQRMVLP